MLSNYLIHQLVICFKFFFQNFNPNPYFEDTKLTKTFTFLEEGTTTITATPIKWKEGKVSPHSFLFFFCLRVLLELFNLP